MATIATRKRKCLICNKPMAGDRLGVNCDDCDVVLFNIREAHDDECYAPHADQETRLLEFERRQALGLPLWDRPRDSRAA